MTDIDQIEKVRETLGWNKKKMATELGVTQQTYSQWVGKVLPPKNIYVKYANLLLKSRFGGFREGVWEKSECGH